MSRTLGVLVQVLGARRGWGLLSSRLKGEREGGARDTVSLSLTLNLNVNLTVNGLVFGKLKLKL
jgi:hypothetical protein